MNIWIAYNREILKNIKTLPAEKYLFVEHSSLLDRDKEIFGHLKNSWGFDLEYYDFKKIFKENLLSAVTDIDLFVTDKTLLMKAQNLEEELKKLCSKKKSTQKELR